MSSSSQSETSERPVPVFYDREELFKSLFGDFEPEPEPEPEAPEPEPEAPEPEQEAPKPEPEVPEPEANEATSPQIIVPFKKRSGYREVTNNVVEKEESSEYREVTNNAVEKEESSEYREVTNNAVEKEESSEYREVTNNAVEKEESDPLMEKEEAQIMEKEETQTMEKEVIQLMEKEEAELKEKEDNQLMEKEENQLMEKEGTQLMEKEETQIKEKEHTTKQSAMEDVKSEGGTKKMAYELCKSGARKFVIKSYRKSEELRKKAELEKNEREERAKGKSLIETDQEINTSGNKGKMKEKESNADDSDKIHFLSRTIWSRKRQEESSPYYIIPKSLSIEPPEKIKEKKKVKRGKGKGKELAQGNNSSSQEKVSKKRIRVKTENTRMKNKKELKGDKMILPEEGSRFQYENMVQRPTSSKKHKSMKELMIEGENQATNNLNNGEKMEENAAMIPVICKKPRSNKRGKINPEQAQ